MKLTGFNWKSLLRPFLFVPFLTLLFLIGIDVLLRQGNIVDALGFRSVDMWNLPERLELAKKTEPDVALIGSSLLLVLNQQDDRGRNFYSGTYPPYFQEELRKATGQKVSCINLCSGLQMVSESYMIGEAVAHDKNPPKVIIYGLSLRDFIHDSFAKESATDSFASIAPYCPVNWSTYSHISKGERGEFLLDHYWYLYRDRTDFKNLFVGVGKDLLENLGLDEPYYRLGRYNHAWLRQKDGWTAERWVVRKQEKFTEEIFRKRPQFLKKYYRDFQATIYQQGKLSTMQTQTAYLQYLIDLCKEKNIKLVLVNMPLSPEIMPLVPDGLYDAFRYFLTTTAKDNKLALIDFYENKNYDNDSFKDGVHLNYAGARRLADDLITALKTQYPDVLAAMGEHAHGKIAGALDEVGP